MLKLRKFTEPIFQTATSSGLTPRSQNCRYTKNLLKRSKRVWLLKLDRWLGRMWIMEKILLISIISSQKLYFGDVDAIYDFIIQEPFWKWRHYYRHEISRDHYSSRHIQQFFIFKQIDRSNFVVRGPSSLGANWRRFPSSPLYPR